MTEVYSGNIVKCSSCGKYITYSDSDIYTRECDYGVGTYNGEFYTGKFIKCPHCGREIEIY